MNTWHKLSMILTLQCEEASRLTSESLERPLKLHERLALLFHSCVCFSCRQFAKQLRFIRNAFQVSHRQEMESLEQGPQLSDDIKERLKRIQG